MPGIAAWMGRRGPLWLVLLTILVHAALPVGSPLSRTIGSAFSASTSDVSLSPQRKGLPAADQQEVDPGSSGKDGVGAAEQAAIRAKPDVVPLVTPVNGATPFRHREPAIAWRPSAFSARGPPTS